MFKILAVCCYRFYCWLSNILFLDTVADRSNIILISTLKKWFVSDIFKQIWWNLFSNLALLNKKIIFPKFFGNMYFHKYLVKYVYNLSNWQGAKWRNNLADECISLFNSRSRSFRYLRDADLGTLSSLRNDKV